MRLTLLFSLFLCSADAQQASGSSIPAGSLVLQSDENGRRTWHSKRFVIESTADIPTAELTRLTKVADGTVQAIASNPLPLFRPPDGERLRIVILHDDSSYAAEGGRIGSAGMYLWRKRCVILHAQHLFARQRPTRLKPRANAALIVHEISHLCMHGIPPQIPQWLKEGLCEYFAAAHDGAGRFRFGDPDRSIREHLRGRFDPGEPVIQVAPISDIANLDSRQWSGYLDRLSIEQHLFPYATALLLTHYYLHGGSERRNLVVEALELNPRDRTRPFGEILEKSSKIQDQLQVYWRPKGLQFKILPANPLPTLPGGPARDEETDSPRAPK